MMLIKEPSVTFTTACPGVKSQRQVFSLPRTEPSGSLFLPSHTFEAFELVPVGPMMGIISSQKLLVRFIKLYLEGT